MESVTKFFTVKMDGYDVVTGWKYKSSEEDSPYLQYCYAWFPVAGYKTLQINLAGTANGYLPYDKDMEPLTREEYRKAVPQCTWAKGLEPR